MYSLDWQPMFDGEIIYKIRDSFGYEIERHSNYHEALNRLNEMNKINYTATVSIQNKLKGLFSRCLKTCALLFF